MSAVVRSHPLAVILVCYLFLICISFIAPDPNIGVQLMSSVVLALFALTLLLMLNSRYMASLRLRGMRGKGIGLWSFYIVAVAAVAFCVSLLVLPAFGGSPAADLVELCGEENALSLILPRVLPVILLCFLTGIYEELYFRAAATECLGIWIRQGVQLEDDGDPDAHIPDWVRKRPLLAAALLGSMLFGVMHLSTGAGASAAMSSIGSAEFWMMVLNAVAKMAQATMFGFCMVGLMVRSGSIWPPVLVHFIFDLLYLGPELLLTASVPATYVTGNCGDIVLIALTIVLLVPPCIKSARWLGLEVLPYSSTNRPSN